MAADGNVTDFGDLSVARAGAAGGASPTRGLFMGGGNPRVDTTDYITIASTGNATDFGDRQSAAGYAAGCSNDVRALTFGGTRPLPGDPLPMQYIGKLWDLVDRGSRVVKFR